MKAALSTLRTLVDLTGKRNSPLEGFLVNASHVDLETLNLIYLITLLLRTIRKGKCLYFLVSFVFKLSLLFFQWSNLNCTVELCSQFSYFNKINIFPVIFF